jgi:hypothetical protein
MGLTQATTAAPRATDGRTRAQRLRGPVLTAAGLVAAVGFIRVVDPNEPGHYPMCPTLALLGIDCPGCGGLRATHALAHGDVAMALDHNALFVVLVPLVVALWTAWTYRAWTGVRAPRTAWRDTVARAGPIVLLIVAMGFAVVRNFVPYLGSGAG